MHRAKQIQDQIAALHEASSSLSGVAVFTNRSLSLETQIQPGICIDIGRDDPYDSTGQQNIAFIDSLLDVSITLYADGVDENEVMDKLMEMRSASHVVMMGTAQLGLSFVSLARYGGSLTPDFSVSGRTAGKLETQWTIQYRMNLSSPE